MIFSARWMARRKSGAKVRRNEQRTKFYSIFLKMGEASESPISTLIVRLALSGSPLGLDSPSAWLGLRKG